MIKSILLLLIISLNIFLPYQVAAVELTTGYAIYVPIYSPGEIPSLPGGAASW